MSLCHPIGAVPKGEIVRDRKYLDSLRYKRGLITGRYGDEYETVDPTHMGTAGKGIKSGDDEAGPFLHSIHLRMHNEGEMTVLRELASDDLLRDAFRALFREMYRAWKKENE